MVRVALHIDHPGAHPDQRFEVSLPQLPRPGEYVRAGAALLQLTGAHPEAELWRVVAIVHEAAGGTVEATLHVVATDMRDIFDQFEHEPGA